MRSKPNGEPGQKPTENRWAQHLRAAVTAVQAAEKILLARHPSLVKEKTDRDTVTDIDLLAQKTIRDHLATTTPGIAFFGEEDDGHPRPPLHEGLVWLADAIDGTSNFTHDLPLYAVSLALLDQGVPVAAAVSVPLARTRYTAAQGHGAHANGARLRLGGPKQLRKSVVTIGDFATGADAEPENQRRHALLAALAAKAERVRLLGSAAVDLAFLAEGRVQASAIPGARAWDVAAGALIAHESGALLTDFAGAPWTLSSQDLLASDPAVSEELRTTLEPQLSSHTPRAPTSCGTASSAGVQVDA